MFYLKFLQPVHIYLGPTPGLAKGKLVRDDDIKLEEKRSYPCFCPGNIFHHSEPLANQSTVCFQIWIRNMYWFKFFTPERPRKFTAVYRVHLLYLLLIAGWNISSMDYITINP